MSRIWLLLSSALLLLLSLAARPVSSFAVPRHLAAVAKSRRDYHHGPQPRNHVRTNSVELHNVVELMDMTAMVPVGIFVTGIAGAVTQWMNNATSVVNTNADDTAVVLDKEDLNLTAAKEAIGVAEDTAIDHVLEQELKEAIEEVKAAPSSEPEPPAPKPAPQPLVQAPPPAPKPVPPPPPPPPKPVVVKAPPAPKPAPPKPAPPKPEPVVVKTPAAAPAPAVVVEPVVVVVTPEPATLPDLPPAAPTPRFHAFRQKKTEKTLAELKREVSSTLEGEKEKGERLRQAAAAKQREGVVVQKVESGIAAAKAATSATAATIVSASSAKDIKLKKSSSKPATTTTLLTRTTVDTDTVDETTDTADANDKPVEKRGLRRKAWRVVKKVVAPWRKWKNIK